jgi:3-deoxy-manno-octulosonate cytidylyltransferase (CMP-KDO synthetase)
MTDTLIVIPARFKSKRFPGKVLVKVGGRSILRRVYESCKRSQMGRVMIATDSKKVAAECGKFGAGVVMTSAKCRSGSDRVWQVAKKYRSKYIVNVQADMPFIKPATVKNVLRKLKSVVKCDIATAYCDMSGHAEIKNPNNVKIVMTGKGKALYFSRAIIPYPGGLKRGVYHKHYGIYAFKRKTLGKFVKSKPSLLESTEKLEQLRALESGMSIYCVKVPFQGPAVDTPKDLKKAQKYLKGVRGKNV